MKGGRRIPLGKAIKNLLAREHAGKNKYFVVQSALMPREAFGKQQQLEHRKLQKNGFHQVPCRGDGP